MIRDNLRIVNKAKIDMLITNLILLSAALASLIAVQWIFLRILKVAKIKGLVDNPDARKLQKSPVPVLGGLAVFFGLISGILTFSALYHATGVALGGMTVNVIPVLIGASVMLYTGTLDDIMGLTPRTRLLIESLTILGIIYGSGMCIDSLHGLWGIYEYSWWIAVPLTIFASVGIINAYNMVDGVNGLSSGLCITSSCIVAVICWKRQDYADSAIALCFAASLLPFLMHNVFGKRSRMFIGDGGTMVMGLLVSWFVIRVLSSQNAEPLMNAHEDRKMCLVGMTIAVTCVPIADTLRVMAGRMLRGVSPLRADKTHLHHAFIDIGVSHSITALSEVLINVFVVTIWFIVYRMDVTVEVQLYTVVASAIILVWGTYWFLNMEKYRESTTGYRLRNLGRKSHLGHTNGWLKLQRWLDKGSYEDYKIILRENLEKPYNMLDEKERDVVAIVNYLQGKNIVEVHDIINESGADSSQIYPILLELEEEEVIEVAEWNNIEAAQKVRLLDF